MSPLLQSLVVAAIVLACTVSVLRRLAPRIAWQAQARLSFALERRRAGWMRRLGRVLRPPVQASAAACGTGGCNTCNSCE